MKNFGNGSRKPKTIQFTMDADSEYERKIKFRAPKLFKFLPIMQELLEGSEGGNFDVKNFDQEKLNKFLEILYVGLNKEDVKYFEDRLNDPNDSFDFQPDIVEIVEFVFEKAFDRPSM